MENVNWYEFGPLILKPSGSAPTEVVGHSHSHGILIFFSKLSFYGFQLSRNYNPFRSKPLRRISSINRQNLAIVIGKNASDA